MRYIKIWLTCMAWGLMHSASAQGVNGAYPNRPLTVVVPMSAGGTSDLIARMLMPALGNLLGQSVMVENRVGANGAIGEDYFSRAKPDGYTLMLESTSMATNPWMNTLSYDPRSAFIPVIQIASVPLVLVVNSKLSANECVTRSTESILPVVRSAAVRLAWCRDCRLSARLRCCR